MALSVKYFIPEDGDDATHPNVFSVQKGTSAVTLGAVKRAFPLPGSYHFRFLHVAGSVKVWLDVLDENAVVPSGDDGIFAKISRSSSAFTSTSTSNLSPISTVQSSADKQSRTSERLINFDSDSGGLSPIASKSEPKLSVPAMPGSNTQVPASSSSSANILGSASDDLIGFNAAIEVTASSSSSRNSSNIDLFGLDSLQPVIATQIPQQQPHQQHQSTRPGMPAMGGMVRPVANGFGDPFSGLGQGPNQRSSQQPPPNPYQPRGAPNGGRSF